MTTEISTTYLTVFWWITGALFLFSVCVIAKKESRWLAVFLLTIGYCVMFIPMWKDAISLTWGKGLLFIGIYAAGSLFVPVLGFKLISMFEHTRLMDTFKEKLPKVGSLVKIDDDDIPFSRVKAEVVHSAELEASIREAVERLEKETDPAGKFMRDKMLAAAFLPIHVMTIIVSFSIVAGILLFFLWVRNSFLNIFHKDKGWLVLMYNKHMKKTKESLKYKEKQIEKSIKLPAAEEATASDDD